MAYKNSLQVAASARTVIIIDDVNTAKRLVEGVDNKGGKIQAYWTNTPTGFQIPAQGDNWTIIRYGYIWYLDSRFDTLDEHNTKLTLDPGDVHFRTPGNVVFDTDSLMIGGGILGVTTQDTIKTTGTTASFTLSATPVDDRTVQVYANGTLLHPALDWTLSGNTISFVSSLSTNTKLTVYYQRFGNEYRESETVTAVSNLSTPAEAFYHDAGTAMGVTVPSAIESR